MKTVPTGFSGVPPPGPAMPVTASAKSEPNFSRAPSGHFARHRLAHRAVLRQSFCAHTKEFFLRRIRVAHHAARKNRRRTRHIRHPLRDAAARAGFRQRQGFLPLRQQTHHDLFNFVIVKTENIFAEDFFARRLTASLDKLFPPLRRRPPAAHPPRRAARSNQLPIRAARAVTNPPSTISCTRDSPMPVERNVRQMKISSANSRFSNGTTESSNIGRSSRGGPGSIINQREDGGWRMADGRTSSPRCESASNGERAGVRCRLSSILQPPSSSTRMASPGAVPVGFKKTSAPSGTKVSTLVFAGRGRPRLAKKFSICASTSLFSTNFLPSSSGNEFAREVVRSRAQSAGGDDQIRAVQGFAHGLLDLISRHPQSPPVA